MAGKLKSIFRKLGTRLYRTGRPKAPTPKPTVAGGHRGIAAGSLKMRHERMEKGEAPYSGEEIKQWENLSPSQATEFVYDGQPLFVHSSNVSMFQYFPEDRKLMVEFLGKGGRPPSAYMYSNVTEEEAIEAVQSHSKGGFCWDVLRVRGSKTEHKKPYQRIR